MLGRPGPEGARKGPGTRSPGRRPGPERTGDHPPRPKAGTGTGLPGRRPVLAGTGDWSPRPKAGTGRDRGLQSPAEGRCTGRDRGLQALAEGRYWDRRSPAEGRDRSPQLGTVCGLAIPPRAATAPSPSTERCGVGEATPFHRHFSTTIYYLLLTPFFGFGEVTSDALPRCN